MGLVNCYGQPISAEPLTEEQVSQLMADEIRRLEQPALLAMPPADLLQLVGLLQLAGRHPEISPTLHDTIDAIVETALEYFAECPTVLEIIRRGDDPSQDV